MPEPDRRGQILQRNHDTNKAVGLGWVMRGTHLEHHLLLFAQIERLDMASPAQVPYMHLMAVFAAQKKVRLQSAFNHVRRAPLAAQQRVETQMPPKIVVRSEERRVGKECRARW